MFSRKWPLLKNITKNWWAHIKYQVVIFGCYIFEKFEKLQVAHACVECDCIDIKINIDIIMLKKPRTSFEASVQKGQTCLEQSFVTLAVDPTL